MHVQNFSTNLGITLTHAFLIMKYDRKRKVTENTHSTEEKTVHKESYKFRHFLFILCDYYLHDEQNQKVEVKTFSKI